MIVMAVVRWRPGLGCAATDLVFVCCVLASTVQSDILQKDSNYLRYVMLHPSLELVFNARDRGSHSRFARRSCKPNARLQGVYGDGVARLALRASTAIEPGAEITVPFDFEAERSPFIVDCGCEDKDDCPMYVSCGGGRVHVGARQNMMIDYMSVFRMISNDFNYSLTSCSCSLSPSSLRLSSFLYLVVCTVRWR